jgi:opacity protein-like surface antigen
MFHAHRRILLTLLTLLLIWAVPASAMDLGGHDRDGVVVGVLLGYGWNSVEFKDETGAERSFDGMDTFNGDFRVGWARSDHVVGSIGFNGWKRSYYQDVTPITSQYYSFNLQFHWYPMGEGFWIKPGVGYGTLDFTAQYPPGNAFQPLNFNEAGLALLLGVGYEFRVADTFAIGISYDYQTTDVGDFAGGVDTTPISSALSLSLVYYAD